MKWKKASREILIPLIVPLLYNLFYSTTFVLILVQKIIRVESTCFLFKEIPVKHPFYFFKTLFS